MRRVRDNVSHLPAVVALLLLVVTTVVHGADRTWGYRVAGSYSAPNDGGLFDFTPIRRYGLQELFLSYAGSGVYAYGTVYNEAQSGDTPLQKGVVNELYATTKAGEWDVTLGKKRVSWGNGFGFRPLDLIKPVPPRALIPKTPEGLPMVALDYYTGQSALTLLVGNDFQYNRDNGYQSASTESAARYFTTVNGWDLQAVAHRRADIDYEAGLGFAVTTGESLEIHGSALYQKKYQKFINTLTAPGSPLLASTNTVLPQTFNDGAKALLGATYTWRSGHNLLWEYWYDASGYTASEWRALRDLTRSQRAPLVGGGATTQEVTVNIGWDSSYLQQPNLLQQNLLLRWWYDNGEHFVPEMDLLYTPQDGGAAVTASAVTEVGTTYVWEYGIRYFTGYADSVYHNLPMKYALYASVKATFRW